MHSSTKVWIGIAVILTLTQIVASAMLQRGIALTAISDFALALLLLALVVVFAKNAIPARGRLRAFWIMQSVGLVHASDRPVVVDALRPHSAEAAAHALRRRRSSLSSWRHDARGFSATAASRAIQATRATENIGLSSPHGVVGLLLRLSRHLLAVHLTQRSPVQRELRPPLHGRNSRRGGRTVRLPQAKHRGLETLLCLLSLCRAVRLFVFHPREPRHRVEHLFQRELVRHSLTSHRSQSS